MMVGSIKVRISAQLALIYGQWRAARLATCYYARHGMVTSGARSRARSMRLPRCPTSLTKR